MHRDKGKNKQHSGTAEGVLLVFSEVNKVQSASKAQVFQLARLFRENSSDFTGAFELAFLKIFKIFHEKANRKMPVKFEQLAASLFTELLGVEDEAAVAFFNYFLAFLAEGVFSSIQGIRIATARMMFQLAKQGTAVITSQTRGKVLQTVFFLVRLKVSTYKQLGIKLASLVLSWNHQLRDKIELELFKILATEDNEQIRKMAITNMAVGPKNLDKVLIRLRDKSSDIRSIVLRKLVGEKYKLETMSACNRLHLLYDGYGNKEPSIQQDTLRYFTKFLDGGQGFAEFVDLFRPGVLLVYPHMYALFDSLICSIVEELPFEHLCNFTKTLTNQLKQLSKGSGRLVLPQFIWLKNMGRAERADAKTIYEQCVPSGLELSRILLELLKGKDVWSINECLQLFSLQRSADELGRNKMFDSLKKVVTQLEYFEVVCDWSGLEHDDLCPPLSEQAIFQRKMMLSYFDLPLLSNSYDLLHEAGNAMKALWPDHYEIELKQIMAEWNNPQENTLLKEKEITLANIAKLQAQGDARLLGNLKAKLADIEEQLLMEGVKTRSIIMILNRLRAGISMDDFMPVIKEDLGKRDQSQGLILLGLYCLDEAERVERFMPIYWLHIITEERFKLHLLVSLKVTTDFLVKFDLSKLATPHQDPEKGFTLQRYLKRMLQLVLDSDADVRILAIEGLCRLLYHGRVGEEEIGSCFMRLLLLWWETSSEEVSAKAVHTISIFVKQFIERGSAEVRKLAQALCVFFRVLLVEQSQRRSINKRKIVYSLRLEQFVKRSVVIAMTVLKYHKQSRQVIWKYQQSGAELGPQQLFILFLLHHQNLHYCLEKALNICDFYEEAPLETVILLKKEVEVLLEGANFASRKNLEASLRKLQRDLEDRIQIKNQETFNEELLNGLRKELKEYELLINETAQTLAKELEEAQIFTDAPELFGNIKVEREDSEHEQVEVDAVIADIEEAIPISSESEHPSRKQNNRNNLSRISEGNESEDDLLRRSDEKHRQQAKQQKEKEKEKKRNNRKRQPEPPNDQSIEQSSSQLPQQKAIIPLRTRSKHRV